MRTFVVVEVNCTGYGRDDFSDACKVHVFKEFVFHCIVDSLRLGVVFGVSGFGHADADMPAIQNADIVRTGVLAATVGVVDKMDTRLPVNASQSHFKGLHRVCGLERGADTPADNLFCIGIHDERQIAERIMALIRPDNDIRNVTCPQLVGAGGNKVPDEIGICGKPV